MYLALIDEEREPDTLTAIWELTTFINQSSFELGDLSEDLHQLTSMYWPVEFKSASDQNLTKKKKLKLMLDQVLISTSAWIEFNFVEILEKLQAAGKTSKFAALELLIAMCETYPNAWSIRPKEENFSEAVFSVIKDLLDDDLLEEKEVENVLVILTKFTAFVDRPQLKKFLSDVVENDGLSKLKKDVVKKIVIACASSKAELTLKTAKPMIEPQNKILDVNRMHFLTQIAMAVVPEAGILDLLPTETVLSQFSQGTLMVQKPCLPLLLAFHRLDPDNEAFTKELVNHLLAFNQNNELRAEVVNALAYLVSIKKIDYASVCERSYSLKEKAEIFSLNLAYLNQFYESLNIQNSDNTMTTEWLTALKICCISRNYLPLDPNIRMWRGFTFARMIFSNLRTHQEPDLDIWLAFKDFLSSIVKISPEESSSKFVNEFTDLFLVDKDVDGFNPWANEYNYEYLEVLLIVISYCPNVDIISNKSVLISHLLGSVVQGTKKSTISGKILGCLVNKSKSEDKLNKIVNYCRTISQTSLLTNTGLNVEGFKNLSLFFKIKFFCRNHFS